MYRWAKEFIALLPANDFHLAKGASCECSEGDAAGSSYNATLGPEYAHDSAGNNYYVGDESLKENGRDGPGYYKTVGGYDTKLQDGLQ